MYGFIAGCLPAQEKIPNHRMQKTCEKVWKEQGNLPDLHVTKVQDYKWKLLVYCNESSLSLFFLLLVLVAMWSRWFHSIFNWGKFYKEMWAEGEFRCIGDSKGWIQRDQGRNKSKALQLVRYLYFQVKGRGWGAVRKPAGSMWSAGSLNQDQSKSWGSALFVE